MKVMKCVITATLLSSMHIFEQFFKLFLIIILFTESLEESLQKEVADFLVHLKEDSCATQETIDEVISGIKKIQIKFVSLIAVSFVITWFTSM